ncbi:MAG: hypothetical protein WCI51_13095 [Lentisphaerota bacterium]
MNTNIRPQTVRLIKRILTPLMEEGLISVPELNEVIGNLKHISEKGELLPAILPKLLTQEESASMLAVGLSNFKKLEREGAFSFKRKMVGTSVRYRNTDVISYILASDDSSLSKPTSD